MFTEIPAIPFDREELEEIIECIQPSESAVSRLSDPNKPEFTQKLEDLYTQQQIALSNRALKNHLNKIKEYCHSSGKPPVRCYIVFAFPYMNNDEDEKYVRYFISTLYDQLVDSGISVKTAMKDLGPGENFYRFIQGYADGNLVILVGTRSLYDRHHNERDSSTQTELAIVFNQFMKQPDSLYPLLIDGTFKSSYPEPFHPTEKAFLPSQNYLDILKHLIERIYRKRIAEDNKTQYDLLWEQFYTNPDLSDDNDIFEAIKNHDSNALSNLMTLDKLNIKHDLSHSEIEYMKTRLTIRNGTITDLNLTRELTPLFMAVLYQNTGAYGYLLSRGANVWAKTASGTNLLAFSMIFGERNEYLILQDRHPQLSFGMRDIPIVFEESKPTSMPSFYTAQSSGVFFQSGQNYSLVSTFVNYCKLGDKEGVKACLRHETHKDKEGAGLYEALVAGHEL